MENMVYYFHILEMRYQMKLWIYFEAEQRELYKEIERKIDYTKFEIEKIMPHMSMEDVSNGFQNSVLIVLSQPSRDVIKKWSKYQWIKIMAHIGIREIDNFIHGILKFSTQVEFEEKIVMVLKENLEMFKMNYLKGFADEDPETILYLEKLSGQLIERDEKKKTIRSKMGKFNANKIVKSGLITVVGNPQVSVYLAKSIAKRIKGDILIIDGDLLKPSLDSYYGIDQLSTSIKSHLTGVDNTGFNMALDALDKGFKLETHLDTYTKKIGQNARVLLGNYNIYNYEHYDEMKIRQLLSKLSANFQIIILHVSSSAYDLVTMMGLHVSSINLFACEASIPEIRYNYNLLKLLNSKQGLPEEKNLVLSYSVQKNHLLKRESVPQEVFVKLFKNNYIGKMTKNRIKTVIAPSSLNKIIERMRGWD